MISRFPIYFGSIFLGMQDFLKQVSGTKGMVFGFIHHRQLQHVANLVGARTSL